MYGETGSGLTRPLSRTVGTVSAPTAANPGRSRPR
jgi:hypothetical protein